MNKTMLFKRIILIFLLSAASFFTVHTTVNIIYGFASKPKVSDVIVVYGNQVNSDKTPSKRLKARLDKAIDLYKKGFSKYIIVTGGIDSNNNDEALIMKKYLTEIGSIEESIITADSSGINTHHSALFVKSFLKKKGLKSIINVSQYSHIMRTDLAMKKEGIAKTSSCSADYFFEPRNFYSLIRECVAFYYYLFKY